MSEKNVFLYGLLKTTKEVYKLTKQRTSIGRNRNCQIVINNNSVSKDHAIIEFDEDYNCTIKDLNSSNGTYVNGEKLKTTPMKLRTGDKIQFGKYEIDFIFESFHLSNDTKTEPDLAMELNKNSIDNNQMIEPLQFNQYNRPFKDGKINLVNENEISYPKINHFQNKNINLNDYRNRSNGMNYNFGNSDFGQNNQLYNYSDNNKQFSYEDNLDNNIIYNKNNNDNMDNNLNNNRNNFENEEEYYNNQNNNNNSNNNNYLMNSDYTFKNKADELEKRIEILDKEKQEINLALNDKINELKQMIVIFDEFNEEYSKLNSKHNALMVYASDIQKKLDLSNIKINEYKKQNYNEKEFNKILNQKNNMISILQNEVNFYKDLCNKRNIQQEMPFSYNQQMYNNNSQQLNNKLNTISDVFINENKKLKRKLEQYKNTINDIQKNNNNSNINNKNNINFIEFETQINYQIDNFNNIIKDYNSKLSDALNKITELFESNNKEEAAKYLVEQINEYMLENQKLMSENAKLNTQNLELQSLLNAEQQSNSLFNNNNNKNNITDLDSENNISNNYEINSLKNRIDGLENMVENLKTINNSTTDNGNNNLREAFVNVLNELKNKENTVEELQNKLKDTIKRNNMNFDDKQIVNSISQKLKEKDNTIQNLKNKIKSDGIFENESSKTKIEEIRKKRALFN